MSGGSQPFGAFEAVIRRTESERATSEPAPATRRWRVLVMANETCADHTLCTRIRDHAGHGAEVLVVAPAPTSRVRKAAAAARRDAERRLARCVATLAELGLHARAEIADEDPVRALQDALLVFAADEVIIATHPAERSQWLTRGVIEDAEIRFHLPVSHMVVDTMTSAQSEAPR